MDSNSKAFLQCVNDRAALMTQCETLASMVDEMLPKHGPCQWGTIETESARALLSAISRRIDKPKPGITQEELGRVIEGFAPSIDDAKVTRADGTIDGSKLIDEMFGR